jgi:hypothetical protein
MRFVRLHNNDVIMQPAVLHYGQTKNLTGESGTGQLPFGNSGGELAVFATLPFDKFHNSAPRNITASGLR